MNDYGEMQLENRPRNEREGECWDVLVRNEWYIDRRGWPDFLCTANGVGRQLLFCVEVKRHPEDLPTENQLNVMQALEVAGIPCFVWDRHMGFRRMGSACFLLKYGKQPGDVEFADPAAARCGHCLGSGELYSAGGGRSDAREPCGECSGTGLAVAKIHALEPPP